MNNPQPTIVPIPPDSDKPAAASNAPTSNDPNADAPDTPVTLGSYSDNEQNNNNHVVVDTSNDAALAASLAQQEETSQPNYSVATASSPWQYDDFHPQCYNCSENFHALNRRHHCRLCGQVFCHNCSNQKALIPPSQIVLHPMQGKKAKPRPMSSEHISFSPDPDPDRMLTYVSSSNNNNASNNNSATATTNTAEQQLLYGKGLEERFQLAREPIRVCRSCWGQLQPLQEELRRHNSHAMRFNYIDPTDTKRLFNSPLAFTLGHEIRKAAYTLNNLLPQPKRRAGALLSTTAPNTLQSEMQQCQEQCSSVSPNLGDLDGVKIPAALLERAKGVAVLTVVKGGFGLAGVEFGTGLVVARLSSSSSNNSQQQPNQQQQNFWSAPSAIGTAGLSWGALLGAQVSDHVFLLMTDAAVHLMFNNNANFQLGADVGVAVGPLGRALEGDWGVGGGDAAAIYTYSMSKGLYAGISLDGKVMTTRKDINEKFYGYSVSAQEILAGAVPTPPAAQPLYEALQRCHVYASAAAAANHTNHSNNLAPQQQQPDESMALRNEYGETDEGVGTVSDGMSEITFG